MRLPPRQSTAEADLMVPFQLVCLPYDYGLLWFFYQLTKHVHFLNTVTEVSLNFFAMQAALKTIGEEDKYFSKVSLR